MLEQKCVLYFIFHFKWFQCVSHIIESALKQNIIYSTFSLFLLNETIFSKRKTRKKHHSARRNESPVKLAFRVCVRSYCWIMLFCCCSYYNDTNPLTNILCLYEWMSSATNWIIWYENMYFSPVCRLIRIGSKNT